MEKQKKKTSAEEVRLKTAEEKVQLYTLLSVPVGLVPAPALDLALIGAVQLKMVHSLAKVYDTPFSRSIVKGLIGALVSAAVASPTARLATSALKLVPGLGTLSGAIAMSGTGSALTYAVGKVFVSHFEAGGTILNLNARKMKAYFQEKYREAQEGDERITYAGVKP